MTRRTDCFGKTTFVGILVFFAAIALGRAAHSEELAPVRIHVFGAPATTAAAEGVADSVSDLKKAVREKFGKTMRLVDERREADVAVEVVERDRAPSVVRLARCHLGGRRNVALNNAGLRRGSRRHNASDRHVGARLCGPWAARPTRFASCLSTSLRHQS